MAEVPKNCKLYEMVQYQCEVNRNNIECSPYVRMFLRCAGLPTVEVTPEYDQYGDVISSSKSSQETPAATIKGDLEASAHE